MRFRDWWSNEKEHWREIKIGMYKGFSKKDWIMEVLVSHFAWSGMFLLFGDRWMICRRVLKCELECWKAEE